MAYVPLGYRTVKAAVDTTGQNPGNYTATFDAKVLGIQNPYFEMYKLFLTAPVLAGGSTQVDVGLNLGYWDTTLIGQRNAWDANQALLMTPGDTLYVYFNVPTSNTTVPVVYAWFRYQN